LLVIAILSQACAVTPERPPERDIAWLPYVEAVELPESVRAGVPFKLRLRLSTDGNPGILNDGTVHLNRYRYSGDAYLTPYVSFEPGGSTPVNGWYEFDYTLFPLRAISEPTSAKVIVSGAPSPSRGGEKGTVEVISHNVRFLVDYRRQEFPITLNP